MCMIFATVHMKSILMFPITMKDHQTKVEVQNTLNHVKYGKTQDHETDINSLEEYGIDQLTRLLNRIYDTTD